MFSSQNHLAITFVLSHGAGQTFVLQIVSESMGEVALGQLLTSFLIHVSVRRQNFERTHPPDEKQPHT